MTAGLVEQLSEELSLALAVPASTLLGPMVGLDIQARIHEHVPLLAAQLTQDDDPRMVGQTVTDIMSALWPHGAPEDVGQADWWLTPLGKVCARSLARDDADSVTQAVAGLMLGVTRGTIAQMVSRGTLDRHTDGGVLRSSILARIAR